MSAETAFVDDFVSELIGPAAISAVWLPHPDNHPQQMAYHSAADVIGYGGSAGGGKALSIHVIIPTPEGYRLLGDLRTGDEVFGMDGCIYRIVGTSEVMFNRRIFDVEFDDGTIIRADGDHKWRTFTYAERMAMHKRSDEYRHHRREKRAKRSIGKRPDLALRNPQRAAAYLPEPVTGGVRTTLEIRETLFANDKGRINHAIPVAAPLQLPDRELPIDPYVLGFWLGDGNSYAGRITVGDKFIGEVRSILGSAGFAVTKVPSERQGYTVRGLQRLLRLNGFLRNKHIPEGYLFSSFEQRRALLQGLMDTDGYALSSGQCEFYNSKFELIRSVSRLLHTLGIKHAVRTKKPPKGTTYSESFRIKFVAPFPVFRLSFNANRQNTDLLSTQKWRYIVDVREVDSEPAKCIAIDSPDHLYLAGEACIPTHNTDLLLGKAFTQFQKAIIFRQHFTDLVDIVTRGDEIMNGRCSFVWGVTRRWTMPDWGQIEGGGV